jgi:Fe-Mn family superoxide dismutase
MSENRVSRRSAIVTLTLGTLAGCAAQTKPVQHPKSAPSAAPTTDSSVHGKEAPMAAQVLRGDHTVVALPFDPARLNGLSERMIRSHHENNYAGAVNNLNGVEQQLSAINKDTPPFLVAALRERELTFRGSKLLHERYFENLGGDGKRAGAIEKALADAYGSSARWEEHYRATGLGLGGGSGWVILGYELDTGMLRTFWSGNHTQALAMSVPLLVMDMYEHSYQMDFGAAAAKYIDAFFANANWEVVNRQLAAAQRARAALVG